MKSLLIGLAFSGGLPLLVFLCSKYLSNTRWQIWGISWGEKISAAGRLRAGKIKWEKIESQILEKHILGGLIFFFKGIFIGLNKDDDL